MVKNQDDRCCHVSSSTQEMDFSHVLMETPKLIPDPINFFNQIVLEIQKQSLQTMHNKFICEGELSDEHLQHYLSDFQSDFFLPDQLIIIFLLKP